MKNLKDQTTAAIKKIINNTTEEAQTIIRTQYKNSVQTALNKFVENLDIECAVEWNGYGIKLTSIVKEDGEDKLRTSEITPRFKSDYQSNLWEGVERWEKPLYTFSTKEILASDYAELYDWSYYSGGYDSNIRHKNDYLVLLGALATDQKNEGSFVKELRQSEVLIKHFEAIGYAAESELKRREEKVEKAKELDTHMEWINSINTKSDLWKIPAIELDAKAKAIGFYVSGKKNIVDGFFAFRTKLIESNLKNSKV